MRIVNYGPDNVTNLPVTGGGSALVAGALLKRGPTPGTNNGMLVLAAANSTAWVDAVGILREAHATANDTTISGTVFTTHPIQIIVPGRVVRVEYSLATADLIQCTQAVSTTTMTVTSLEDNIDAAFLYVDEGTGAGQTNYLTASASGSCTLKAAFGTSLDTTSYFAKILPRFHPLCALTSDGTKLASVAAAGVHTCMVLDTWIERNNRMEQFNPTKHAALTGLNGLRQLSFWADILIRDSFVYSLD